MRYCTPLDATVDLATLDPEATTYAAKPWTPSSVAIVAADPFDRVQPAAVRSAGCCYFLEVFIATEVIATEVLDGWGGTLTAACDRLIRHATYDA